MNSNKILTGGIAGGIAYFFIAWLVYGVLLVDFMTANTNQCLAKPMAEMTWWAIMLSSLVSGLLISTIFSWSGISGAASGAKSAAIIGFLIQLSYGLSWYSMTTMYSTLGIMAVDVIVCTLTYALFGAVVGAVMGMGKKEVA